MAEKNKNRTLFLGCAIVAVLFFMAVLSGLIWSGTDVVPSPEPAAAPGTLAVADRQIAEVKFTEATKFGSIKVELGPIAADKDLPVHAAMVLEAVGKAVQAGVSDMPAGIETLNLWFTAPVADGAGNESRDKVMEFRVKVADLKGVNYANVAPQNLLELVQDSWVKLAARKGVADYCAEKAATNPRFCAQVRE